MSIITPASPFSSSPATEPKGSHADGKSLGLREKLSVLMKLVFFFSLFLFIGINIQEAVTEHLLADLFRIPKSVVAKEPSFL